MPTQYGFGEVQRRIRLRLKELGDPPVSSLASSHGLGRDFIRDIIVEKPRKKSIGADKIGALARALQCDPEYLDLTQELPARGRLNGHGGMPMGAQQYERAQFIGFLEMDTWRPRDAEFTLPAIFDKTFALPLIDGECQIVGIMRGREMAAIGLADDMYIVATRYHAAPLTEGKVVLVRRFENNLTEQSLRIVSYDSGGQILKTAPLERPPKIIRPKDGEVEIFGLVRQAIYVF